MKWKGVMPAITTCFDQNMSVCLLYTSDAADE